MQVALYGRVSTKDKGQDHENQFRELRRLANKLEYEIVEEYVDQVSASGKFARDNFTRMLNDARVRKFDLILFWSLDRLSREGVLETLTYLKNLNDWGVGWKSYTEQYLDSTGIFKEAIIGILAAIAKQERVRISERTLAGLSRAREHGTKSGKSIGRQRKIFRRDLAEEMRRGGKSIREIGKALGVAHTTVAKALREQGVQQPISPLVLSGVDSEPFSELVGL